MPRTLATPRHKKLETRSSKVASSIARLPTTIELVTALQAKVGNAQVTRMLAPEQHAASPTGSGSCVCGGRCDRCRGQAAARQNARYEREADHVATQVTRQHGPGRVPASSRPPAVPRPDHAPAGARDGGRPLAPAIRGLMESQLGADLSDVRVHEASGDRARADRLGAKAFTFGEHIYLGTNAVATDFGLMAHELAHVVQQQPRRRRRDGDGGARNLGLSPAPQRIMRQDWSSDMSPRNMPRCVAQPQHALFPSEVANLGTVSNPARQNCTYTPLFRIPSFRLPDGRNRVTIRARVPRVPPACAQHHWSINVYECHSDGTSFASQLRCHDDRSNSRTAGRISGPALEVAYPSRHGGLWSTRNLSVRIRSGCPTPIPVQLSVVYPTMPEPTAWEQASQGIHMILDLLGLTEPFGVAFDGANAIIYAAEGDWLNAGLSVGAVIPLAGAGAVSLRRMRRGGEEVIGMEIRRSVLPTLRSQDVALAIRRARQRSRPVRTPPRHAPRPAQVTRPRPGSSTYHYRHYRREFTAEQLRALERANPPNQPHALQRFFTQYSKLSVDADTIHEARLLFRTTSANQRTFGHTRAAAGELRVLDRLHAQAAVPEIRFVRARSVRGARYPDIQFRLDGRWIDLEVRTYTAARRGVRGRARGAPLPSRGNPRAARDAARARQAFNRTRVAAALRAKIRRGQVNYGAVVLNMSLPPPPGGALTARQLASLQRDLENSQINRGLRVRELWLVWADNSVELVAALPESHIHRRVFGSP